MVKFDWGKLTDDETRREFAEGMRMLPNHVVIEVIFDEFSRTQLEELAEQLQAGGYLE